MNSQCHYLQTELPNGTLIILLFRAVILKPSLDSRFSSNRPIVKTIQSNRTK